MERLTMHTPDNFGYAEYQLKPGVDEQDAVSRLAAYEDTGISPADIADLRNELCLKCGKYHAAHLGSCDGCRWKKGE